MAEYIERDALYDELKNAGGCDAAPSTWDAGWDDAITEAIRLLENSPVADVAPVRHGHWYDKGSLACRCSECGCKNNRESRYCPICGAKMDGGDDHEA